MPDQGNCGRPSVPPEPGSPEWWAQRIVLAELVITPPPAGDSLAYLREYLPLPADTVEPAIAALGAVGLVRRAGDVVRATAAGRYFEHLWPVRPET
jgi:hypothetical protein